jgi:hypothetical protein
MTASIYTASMANSVKSPNRIIPTNMNARLCFFLESDTLAYTGDVIGYAMYDITPHKNPFIIHPNTVAILPKSQTLVVYAMNSPTK